MSERKRKNFSGELKAKVALEAICGVKTINEIGPGIGVASNASWVVEERAASAAQSPSYAVSLSTQSTSRQ